jgi:hypothetical protein
MRFSHVYNYQRALQENCNALMRWFRLVENMHAKYGIVDSDFYNFDKTGFAIGMIQATLVITCADRIAKPKAVQPSNREWATAICSIAADGYVVPPFLYVAGQFHLAAWYSGGQVLSDLVVKMTDNGWIDNETGIEWLQHFDRHTKARQKG